MAAASATNAQGQLNVTNGSFLNNTTASIGGGITSGGPATILNSTIANKFAGPTGGGFGDRNDQDYLTVDGSTFLNNTAAGSGGGIATAGTITTITNTEIDGNTSGGKGGGVFTTGMTLTLGTSTLANNTASDNGGGIELATTGTGANGGSDHHQLHPDRQYRSEQCGGQRRRHRCGGRIYRRRAAPQRHDQRQFRQYGRRQLLGGDAGLHLPPAKHHRGRQLCGGRADAASNLLFTAALDRAEQVPPVNTKATGGATVVLSPDQTTLSFGIAFANLKAARRR